MAREVGSVHDEQFGRLSKLHAGKFLEGFGGCQRRNPDSGDFHAESSEGGIKPTKAKAEG